MGKVLIRILPATKVIRTGTKVKETKVIKTKVTKTQTRIETKETPGVTKSYQGENPREGKYKPPQGGYDPPSDSSRYNQGTNDYDVDTSNISDHPHSVSSITNDDVIVPVFIPGEYLHDPSTLPSHHLNVTVSVQDKDK